MLAGVGHGQSTGAQGVRRQHAIVHRLAESGGSQEVLLAAGEVPGDDGDDSEQVKRVPPRRGVGVRFGEASPGHGGGVFEVTAEPGARGGRTHAAGRDG